MPSLQAEIGGCILLLGEKCSSRANLVFPLSQLVRPGEGCNVWGNMIQLMHSD